MASLEVQLHARPLEDGVWGVAAAGELDAHDAPALERALDDAREAGARRLLLDLSMVPFLDSTILGVVVAASTRFERLVVATDDLRVLRTLQITGLDRRLEVERTASGALARLGGRST